MQDALITNKEVILSEREKNLMKKVFEYNISFVFDKLLYDKVIEKGDIDQLDTEFKKFISLAGFGHFPIAMISPFIDEVWHQFILFTKQYREFCIETVGHFVGHMPDTPETPIPAIAGKNLIDSYKKYFGELPAIWFKGMDKTLTEYYATTDFSYGPPKRWSGFAGPE